MLTIAPPPRARMPAAAARVHRNIGSMLSRIIACHSARAIPTSGMEREVLAGVVDQDVDRSEALARLPEQRVDVLLVGQVGADGDGRPPGLRDRGDDRRGLARTGRWWTATLAPAAARRVAIAGTDPLRGTRDDRHPTRQVEQIARIRDARRHDRSMPPRPAVRAPERRDDPIAGAFAPRPVTRHTPRHAPRGIPPQARLREDAGAGPSRRRRRRSVPGRAIRHPAAPGHPSPLRLPARGRGRPRVVGGPQGPDPRPGRAPDGGPRRGPPHRVFRLRGRHPRRSSTARATSSSGTGAPGRRRRRPSTPRPPSRPAS